MAIAKYFALSRKTKPMLTRTIQDLLSGKVFTPLKLFQRAMRPDRRSVARSFREGMNFRRESSAWSEDRKREWILNRLRFSVQRAYEETSYYQELFKGIGFDPYANFGFDDFARLPVLERGDIQSAGRRLVTSTVSPPQLRKDSTGGSTGVPTEIWRGREEEGWHESGMEYFQRQVGIPEGTRKAALWGHHLDPNANDGLLNRLLAYTSNTRWFDCFRLSPDILERYHEEFERFRPACIIAYASALGHLAEHILERRYRPSYPTRCFVTGAEKLLLTQRKLIEEAFGRPVHERYGSRDVGLMGFQLLPNDTHDFTIDWANIFIEPETNGPDADILVTKLHADGMPMIRYRIGDVGLFPTGSVPGYPSFILREVLGRTTDRIWLPNGTWIHGIQVPRLIRDFPVREFMCLQRPDYSVDLKIVTKPSFTEESQKQIKSTLEANLPGLDIRIAIVDKIPKTKAGKWRFVVSEVNPDRNGTA
jgi:phenylacetate-CoA ligase